MSAQKLKKSLSPSWGQKRGTVFCPLNPNGFCPLLSPFVPSSSCIGDDSYYTVQEWWHRQVETWYGLHMLTSYHGTSNFLKFKAAVNAAVTETAGKLCMSTAKTRTARCNEDQLATRGSTSMAWRLTASWHSGGQQWYCSSCCAWGRSSCGHWWHQQRLEIIWLQGLTSRGNNTWTVTNGWQHCMQWQSHCSSANDNVRRN